MYVIKFAFHIFELCETLYQGRARRDFYEMFLHHIVTLMLIGTSYASNFLPLGAACMFIHDLSDITLNFMKLAIDVMSFRY